MNTKPDFSEAWDLPEKNQPQDIIMICVQCEEEFEFSALEQEKYEDRGYDIPKRCPACRKHKTRNSDLTEHRHHMNRKRNSPSKHMWEEW